MIPTWLSTALARPTFGWLGKKNSTAKNKQQSPTVRYAACTRSTYTLFEMLRKLLFLVLVFVTIQGKDYYYGTKVANENVNETYLGKAFPEFESVAVFLEPLVQVLETGRCKQQVTAFLENLRNSSLWAVQMFDASAKLPQGFLTSDPYDLGNYDGCLEINLNRRQEDNIMGKHCLARFMISGTTCHDDPMDLFQNSDLLTFKNLIVRCLPSTGLQLRLQNSFFRHHLLNSGRHVTYNFRFFALSQDIQPDKGASISGYLAHCSSSIFKKSFDCSISSLQCIHESWYFMVVAPHFLILPLIHLLTVKSSTTGSIALGFLTGVTLLMPFRTTYNATGVYTGTNDFSDEVRRQQLSSATMNQTFTYFIGVVAGVVYNGPRGRKKRSSQVCLKVYALSTMVSYVALFSVGHLGNQPQAKNIFRSVVDVPGQLTLSLVVSWLPNDKDKVLQNRKNQIWMSAADLAATYIFAFVFFMMIHRPATTMLEAKLLHDDAFIAENGRVQRQRSDACGGWHDRKKTCF
ncbi:hypothetical protein RUM44_008007 [Polyplax serrata]|uniref:Nose resistant-to-fluoxetine protein N-terminal domain-containing protein n=1 Tax=Polyplax serrata TaxID=468196 RepID=A0ABR1BBI5_POLSC